MRSNLDTLAFAVHEQSPPALEVRVNFGIYAGREATPAEIDDLAEQLLEKVSSVSIVSEERHEIDDHSEASIHQVRIEIPSDSLPEEQVRREELAGRLIETAERWAGACIAERHVDIA
ncbi:MAG TPA: hypothetical protein VNB86_01040 [Gaiellaceae bacterium]|jgi:hypothetical protein|nr:hypothetical protein [Gaiellaceae bacterium]